MHEPIRQKVLYRDASYPYFEYHAGKAKTIVMIHGLRGTHDGLGLIADALPEYRIIIPDLPGFGDAPALAGEVHALQNYVEYVHSLIKQVTTVPPVLLGHSFGSIVASAYAAQYSDTIEQLVVINPIGSPALKGPKAALTKLALMYYKFAEILPQKAGKKWLSTQISTDVMSRIMTKSHDPKIKRYVRNQHRQHFSRFANTRVVSESFATSVEHTVREFAPDIHIPVLLVVGAKDDITPLEKQKELMKLFDNAKLKVIDETGHLVHYETPVKAAKFIKQFVN